MKYKGFTLVELAIVLVIIGLIMGMAIKGKALIEHAKVVREVSRIRAIETGLYAFYASRGSAPTIMNSASKIDTLYDMRDLINGGFVSNKDLLSGFKCIYNSSRQPTDCYYYVRLGIELPPSGPQSVGSGKNIAAFIQNRDLPNLSSQLSNLDSSKSVRSSWYMYCSMKKIIDGSYTPLSSYTGAFRSASTPMYIESEFDDCDHTTTGKEYMTYTYSIGQL